MFLELALVLARKVCPGFQELKPRGRKRKWTKLVGVSLVVEIDRLVRPDDPAHGLSWAAEQLAQREPWKSFLEIKDAKETSPDRENPSRKAYYEFCGDRLVRVVKDAFAHYELTNTLAEWEKLVADFVKNPGQD